MAKIQQIQPLFTLNNNSEYMGNEIIQLVGDDYNKEIGYKLIDAKNDSEAILAFLNEYKDSPETLRSYAKEIERLLLWCIHVEEINISSLRRNHLLNYQEFLRVPKPKKIWCGPSISKQLKDGSINHKWRPFVKGLTDASIKKTIKILDSFFNYLVQTNYLIGSPLAVDRRRNRRLLTKPKIIDRYLELDEINVVLEILEKYSVKDDAERFQVIRARYIILYRIAYC
jgi:site-specific recombinase XerD